ncbi:MAG TPA: ATP-binding cassette domain-containing protein [Burkholderiaceae bacterium]
MNALRPTCLDSHQGQFVVLLGTSRAGKSTLLRCFNIMQKPDTGAVHDLSLEYGLWIAG